MAEVFIAQTRSNTEENWMRPGEPIRSDAPRTSDFNPAPPPISNADAAVIAYRQPTPPDGQIAAPISIGSVETYATPNRGPISNESGAATIFGDHGARSNMVNMPPPPAPITNQEVRFIPGPAPIQNDPNRTISWIQPKIPGAIDHLPLPPPQYPPPPFYPLPEPPRMSSAQNHQPTVNNEPTQFIRSAPVTGNRDGVYIPPPAEHRGGYQAPQHMGVINVGNSDVQILPQSGPTMDVQGDRTFGGGGNMNRPIRHEEVSFLGKHMMSVGGTEVRMVPSGDQTREAGSEDKTFAMTAGLIGNQETQTGAAGEPVANKDQQDTSFGAIGRPKNVKG